jgi:hypothetical protein
MSTVLIDALSNPATPFTPTLQFVGGVVGIAYAGRSGQWTRIGNRVFFELAVALSSKGSSTGNVIISGLPFTVNTFYSPLAMYAEALTGISGGLMAMAIPGTANINFWFSGTGVPTPLANTHLTNTSAFNISGSYLV